MNDAPFKPKVLALLITLGALSFLSALVWSAVGGDSVSGKPVGTGTDTYSRGALGHSAVAALLRALDLRVVVSRFSSGKRAGENGLLVLCESDPDRLARGENGPLVLEGAERVLVVLPKWRATFTDAADGNVESVSLAPPDTVRRFLADIGIRVAVLRPQSVHWIDDKPRLAQPQLVHSEDLKALIRGAEGILFGRHTDHEGRRIYVLSDPDLIANHGLDDHPNAEIAMKMFKTAREDRETIVFDETLHGFAREPSFWRSLFRFPLVLVLLQLVFACGVLLWAAAGRFGAPLPAPRGLKAGKEFLIGNIASLLHRGGHGANVLRRYYQAAAVDVHRRLRGAGRPGSKTAREWLDRYGAARSVTDGLTELRRLTEDVVRAKRTPAAIQLKIARRIHRWREEMIHGPRRNS